ncbi:hypothetical protein CS542_01375 [Pedobacter sp. IW39]|nr:hypothetical protein CS542_01375 [Pedobacter sp. IW39]
MICLENLSQFTLFCTFQANAQKVGLVLGGGLRFGAYRNIEGTRRKSYPIDYITGTSMGGIVGALYASGYSPEQVKNSTHY